MSEKSKPDFSSTIATTNNNLSRLSKTVQSTATSLVTGELPHHYQHAMNDIARRPQFQKRLFSMKNRAPSELVKGFKKEEIQYRAVTTIPDELLSNLPENTSTFSLFQGFEASVNSKEDDGKLKIKSSEHEKPSRKELFKDQDSIGNRLDLLEIRKDLAANEIKEIDQRIDHLKQMRKIVFERVAKLEQEEFQLENELRNVVEKINDLNEDNEDDEFNELNDNNNKNNDNESTSTTSHTTNSTTEDTSSYDSTNVTEDGLLSQSIYGKLQEKPKKHKKRNTSHSKKSRRKTMPTLQQFYTPGKEIRTIEAHVDSITAVDFDIPFGTMVSASLDDTVAVWDLSRGEKLTSLQGHNASVKCLQMEDNYVLTGSTDATMRLYDLNIVSETPEEDPLIDVYEAHLGEVSALHFYENTIVSGSADKTIRQWDLQTGKCLQTMDVLWASAQSSNTNDDLKWRRQSAAIGNNNSDFVGALQCYDAAMASGTADGIVRLWDLRSGQVHRSLIGHTGPVTCLQFDEYHLATGSLDRSIRIWDLRTGTIFDAFAYDNAITSLHFDSKRVVSADCENTVKVYDREIEKHWSCGAGESDKSASIVDRVRYREGYLVEGRRDGKIGVWAC